MNENPNKSQFWRIKRLLCLFMQTLFHSKTSITITKKRWNKIFSSIRFGHFDLVLFLSKVFCPHKKQLCMRTDSHAIVNREDIILCHILSEFGFLTIRFLKKQQKNGCSIWWPGIKWRKIDFKWSVYDRFTWLLNCALKTVKEEIVDVTVYTKYWMMKTYLINWTVQIIVSFISI